MLALANTPLKGCNHEYCTLFVESGFINAQDADAVTRRRLETVKQLNAVVANACKSGPFDVHAVSPTTTERDVQGVRHINFAYHVLLQRPGLGAVEHVERVLNEVVGSVQARLDAQRC